MATLVGGFCLPHNPLIVGAPDAAAPEPAARVMAAFREVRERIEALQADTVVVIGDDHYTLFGTQCAPSILIGVGDVEGPIEPWLNIQRRPVANHPELAEHLMDTGLDQGFDWAVAKTLVLDHSVMVPVHLSVPDSARVIPVYISSGVKPFIRGQRCVALGRMLGEAIASWPGNERVVVLGTGGISHWVGMADMGRVNQEFDHHILRLVEQGDLSALAALGDDDIIEHGGNGALEIRNWLVALAALRSYEARVMHYEPLEAWITGLGFVEMAVAA